MTEDTRSTDTPSEQALLQEYAECFNKELPIPMFWRLLVKPLEPKEMSRGGIIIAPTQEAQKYATYLGEVLALGSFAGTSERLGGGGKAFQRAAGFPEVGTHIIFGKYAGQRMRYKDTELMMLNDDEILGIAPNPDAFKIYI